MVQLVFCMVDTGSCFFLLSSSFTKSGSGWGHQSGVRAGVARLQVFFFYLLSDEVEVGFSNILLCDTSTFDTMVKYVIN